MELQERGNIEEFMTGPLKDLANNIKNETTTEAVSNSILGYLLGYSSNEEQEQSSSEGQDVLSEKEQAAEQKIKE